VKLTLKQFFKIETGPP